MFLSRITNTFFTSLINRLGVRPPPPEGFTLVNTVQPVSIVDADIALTAVATTLTMGTPFTAGELTAPAAGTVLADTGALAAGNYNFLLVASANELNRYRLQRRNAANTANIWSQLFDAGMNPGSTLGLPPFVHSGRLTLAEGERLRVVLVNAGGGGVVYQTSIWIE